MSLTHGLLLVLLFLIIFFAASYASYKKHKSIIRILYIALCHIGAYMTLDTFFLPFPLNLEGLLSSGGEELVHFADMFEIVPFKNFIIHYKYINIGEYFLSMTDFLTGAMLIGLSFSYFVEDKVRKKRICFNALASIVIPFFCFITYITVGLITGYVWRYVDTTILCVFAGGFWFGKLLYHIFKCLFSELRRVTHEELYT